MDTKGGKSSRLKFSRLCLSQGRGTGENRTGSQLPNSQISRFFSNPNPRVENNPLGTNDDRSPVPGEIEKTPEHEDCDKNKQQNELHEQLDGTSSRKTDRKRTKSGKSVAGDTKSSIKSFFAHESSDNLSDFETPMKLAKKFPKIASSKAKTSRTRRKQPDIRKVLNKQTADSDYSHLPEDAQLAVALALSKAEFQNTESSEQPFSLESYEFKTTNSISSEGVFELFKLPRKANARFKWNSKCTQLTRRKEEVQGTKVRDKIDELLLNNILVEQAKITPISDDLTDYTPYDVRSRHLQPICMSERILFEMNSCDMHSNSNSLSYYTNNLVERSELEAGALLKDWSKIPGRDCKYDGESTTEKTDQSQPTEAADNSIVNSSQHTNEEATEDAQDHLNTQLETAAITPPMPTEMDVDEKLKDEAETDVNMENEDKLPDEDVTLIIDPNDIQLKVDLINIRLSQHCSDIFEPAVVTYEANAGVRALSPDLFDDDDDIDMAEEIQVQNNPDTASILICEDRDDKPSDLPNDVIIISSNSNSASTTQTTQTKAQPLKSSQDLETIEVIDSDSEVLKCSLEQNDMHFNFWDDEYDLMQAADSVNEIEQKQPELELTNSPVLTKKLSFTERLGQYEKDMLNGFGAARPLEELTSQYSNQASNSLELSDDEINYSMRRDAVVSTNDNDASNDLIMDYDLPSPIHFNLPDPSEFEVDVEERLVNQSVCNILEKTFECNDSPIAKETKRKPSISKTLKKVSSERALSSRYERSLPSTSHTKLSRIPLTPNKQWERNESPIKPKNSPSSQHATDTRMDLSNDEYHIRIGGLTPKPDYEQMDATTLEFELRKFGLKPSLRRRQAIICLEYIYNRTHPTMETIYLQNGNEPKGSVNDKQSEDREQISASSQGNLPQIDFNIGFATHKLVDDAFKRRAVDKVFLPSSLRAKKPWCLEPLHIAWHNLIKANKEVHKAVLLYEPINLIELKKYFKTIDMTFDNRDLIAFLDLHCITFRMNKASKE